MTDEETHTDRADAPETGFEQPLSIQAEKTARGDVPQAPAPLEALRTHESRLQFQARLLDSVGQAVIATNLEGTILYWNRAAEQIYGWKSAEVLGRNT